ncbi:MAG TPA: hypothetical protein VFZ25_19340 [Chloroflexota bacterium]|nr:hypothetical protein [Chloroflexota bacterium]
MKRYAKWFLFPVAVVATSVALIAALAVIAIRPAGIALASQLGVGGPVGAAAWATHWHDGSPGQHSGMALPPEIQGLASIPADQRFGHFQGATVSLKDKDGHPLTIQAVPGKITAASATSLAITANDGTARTFALDSSTTIHGKSGANGTPTTASSLQNGDDVVVVTLNNSATATAVVDGGSAFGGNGSGWAGPHG